MTDLHSRFSDWLERGTAGELPRDVAVHASGCEECSRLAAAFDSLLVVDVGAAQLPPMRPTAERAARPMAVRVARVASGVAAVAFLATAVAIGAGSLRGPEVADARPSSSQPAFAEGILGGQGGSASSASASPTGTPSPSATPSPTATPDRSTTAAPAPTPTPATVVAPPPPGGGGVPQPPPATTRPTVRPTTAPTTPSPTPPTQTVPPTTAPTEAPTDTPVPTPTSDPTPPPTPAPPESPGAEATLAP